MKKLDALLIIPILLITSVFVMPTPVRGAATGLVCLAAAGSTACPASPQSFFASPNTNLQVAVFVQGSDPFNNFDVVVIADHTVLAPQSVDLTGSVLPSPSIVLECLQDIKVAGTAPACPVPQDTVDTVDFAAVGGTTPGASGGVTGLLFTITYLVMTRSTGITVNFQTGCAASSVIGSTTCVSINAGSDHETTQGATFANFSDFTLTATPPSVQTPPNVQAMVTIAANSQNGFKDSLTLSTAPTAGLMDSLSSPFCDLSTATTCSAKLTVSSTVAGSYSDNVTATSPTFGIVHFVVVPVLVATTGFGVSASPSSFTVGQGTSNTTAITVTSFTGFSGNVMLSAVVSPAGPTAMVSPSTVPVSTSTPGSATLTVTIPFPTKAGSTFSVKVTGTSGTLQSSTTVTVTVPSPSFTLAALPPSIAVDVGGPATAEIVATSVNGFSGTVTLMLSPVIYINASEPATCDPNCKGNVNASLSSNTIPLTPGSTSNVELTAVSNGLTTGLGNYTLTVTGTSPGQPAVTLVTLESTGLSGLTCLGCEGILITEIDFSVAIPTPNLTVTNVPSGGSTFRGLSSLREREVVTGLGGSFGFGFFNFVGQLVSEPVKIAALGAYPPVCLLPLFYANGTQVPLSVENSTGPIALGGTSTGCKGDSGRIALPGISLSKRVTFIAFANTPLLTYTVESAWSAGILHHTVFFKVTVINPLIFNQLHWKHRLSLSRSGNTQTWTAGVTNPNSIALNVEVVIKGIDTSGTVPISEASAVITIAPGATVNNIDITSDMTGNLGLTFSFSAVIKAGVATLSSTSNQAVFGVPTSGSFTVVA